MRTLTRDVRVARIGLLFFALALSFAFPPLDGFFHRLEGLLIDVHARLHTSAHGIDHIALVDIDEQSLTEIGPWPWPRERLADLIERLLAEHGARAIALDMILPDAGDAAGDERLAALAAHGPVTLAVAFDLGPRHPPLQHGNVGQGLQKAWPVASLTATGHLGNHAGLAQARCTGNIGFIPDADGALRRLPLQVGYAGRYYLTLSAALLDCIGWLEPRVIRSVPLDRNGLWTLQQWRAASEYTGARAADILLDRLPHGSLEGKLVLIGSSALGLADRVATPLSPTTSGLLVHATALAELLHRLKEPRAYTLPLSPIALSTAWCLILTLVLAALPLRPLNPAGLLLLSGFLLAWLMLAVALWHRLPADMVARMTGVHLLLLGGLIPYEWWRSQQQTRKVVSVLSHYVARPVLAEILRQTEYRPLEPKYHRITVLVVDMTGYSRMCESLPLEQAARFTQELLGVLTEPVLDHGGTLDRYAGDGLVAFWGAPLPYADHPLRALRSALALLERMRTWTPTCDIPPEELPLKLRIGIESGEALVGDLGTPFRSTYTAVGECINRAAKLESAARDYGLPLLIGPTAARFYRQAGLALSLVGRLDRGRTSFECWTLAEMAQAHTQRLHPSGRLQQ
ncbi:MAG: adenylate/guanylate cyclase domain-containing protein [Burkholderiales bacterium]|nr:adenylate/guanylate cyclase domain-containing protein [Burkholderiales bacterium]